MIDKVLFQEEQRLMREINAQKGMNLRKFGKILRLNAVMRSIERQQRGDGFRL